jgi:hypothetical protein
MRIELNLPPELGAALRASADYRRTSCTEIIRRAIGLYRLVDIAHREGKFIGISSDPDAFDTVIALSD